MHNATHTRLRQRRTAHCDTATARSNARRQEVPAGCARAAARAASPGARFKELCPKAASPAGPHVPFWDTAPPPQAGGSLTSHRMGPLCPGGLCPAQASAASFQFGVQSFADDPSLSGGILVGSAVPSLRAPEIHPPTLASALLRSGAPAGGRTGEGGVGLGLRVGPSPARAAYLFWCTLCVTDVDNLMWITWWCCPEVVIIATKHS